MGWFKRGWETELEILDEWWFEVTTYVYYEGEYELPTEFDRWTTLLCRFVREKVKMDPTVFWGLGDLIKRREGIDSVAPDPDVTMPIIVNALYLAIPNKDHLWRLGIVDKEPLAGGRKKATSTKQVEALLEEGLSYNQIHDRTGKSAENIRQIKSRSGGKT